MQKGFQCDKQSLLLFNRCYFSQFRSYWIRAFVGQQKERSFLLWVFPFDSDIYIFASGETFNKNLQDFTVGTGGRHYFNLKSYGSLEEVLDGIIGKSSFPSKPLLALVCLTERCVFMMKMKRKSEVCVVFTSRMAHTSETEIGTCTHGRRLLLSW